MYIFRLNRREDVTGKSGTGAVVQGILTEDGVAIMRWLGDKPSTVIREPQNGSDVMDDVASVHGHDGRTVIEWLVVAGSSQVWTTNRELASEIV